MATAEFPGPDFGIIDPTPAMIEECWRVFWLPLIRDEDGRVSMAKLKGELFDARHLVMTAPKVYRLVTGGLTDNPCASYKGIAAAFQKHVARACDIAVNEALQRRER
jgi:hypothetical protein